MSGLVAGKLYLIFLISDCHIKFLEKILISFICKALKMLKQK